MPIALSLLGQASLSPDRLTRTEARDWLASAAVWFEGLGDSVLDARVVRDVAEKPVLLVVLHPASPPVEVRLGGNGRVRVNAVTTPTGPGYHIHLCERIRQFAKEFDVAWDEAECRDPTNYFASTDREACEKTFVEWLGLVCGAACEHTGGGPTCIGIPPAAGFTGPGQVLTPLGPHEHGWLAKAAADPTLARGFFPWWKPDPDAEFYRNRALTRMWCDFPWRPPLTEDEGELTDQIANDLATAYKLDPASELPWREWLEVLAAIDNDEDGHTVNPTDPSLTEAVAQRAFESDRSAPPIGYRRRPMRVALSSDWSIEIPGDFARQWDDAQTWTAWNESKTVWFHPVGFTKPDGSRPSPAEAVAVGQRSLPEGTPVPGIDRDGLRGEAVFGEAEEEGRKVWRLSSVTAAEGQLVVCHVYAEAETDRDWAVQVWHSLKHIVM
ncbi:MAG TPA: hypothetical protein VGL71_12245 [Urbifossiella sp.]